MMRRVDDCVAFTFYFAFSLVFLSCLHSFNVEIQAEDEEAKKEAERLVFILIFGL